VYISLVFYQNDDDDDDDDDDGSAAAAAADAADAAAAADDDDGGGVGVGFRKVRYATFRRNRLMSSGRSTSRKVFSVFCSSRSTADPPSPTLNHTSQTHPSDKGTASTTW